MLSTIRRRVLLPFHETVWKGRKISTHRAFLDRSQWWPRHELEAFQAKELARLLTHAHSNVPYWREIFDRLGLAPSDLADYQKFLRLPITEKADIRQHRARMIASNYLGKTWTKATAGSTDEPLQLDYTPESYDWRVAISRRGYSWAGYEEGMKQVDVWGIFHIGHRAFYADAKDRVVEWLGGRVVLNSLKLDEATMAHCRDVINRERPVAVVGYTNPLYKVAQFINTHGGLTFRPTCALTAAEKLFDYQRVEIERALGCPVFETYGSREFMLIGAECPAKQGLHISVENLLVEIIKEDGTPAAPGETGDIIVTDLHNYGMPFIRYRLGDMAVATNATCSCGRGLPLIQKVVGRTLDVIRTREGRSVPGEFFPHLLKEIRGVRQFQVVQTDLDTLVIKIVKDAEFDDAQLSVLRKEVARLFGQSITLKVEFHDEIPLTKAGKLRLTVSEIRPA